MIRNLYLQVLVHCYNLTQIKKCSVNVPFQVASCFPLDDPIIQLPLTATIIYKINCKVKSSTFTQNAIYLVIDSIVLKTR